MKVMLVNGSPHEHGCTRAALDEVAKEAGELPQTVHSRWQSLCRREPAFLSLANGMIGSGRGRKPQPKRERQMEFTL